MELFSAKATILTIHFSSEEKDVGIGEMIRMKCILNIVVDNHV